MKKRLKISFIILGCIAVGIIGYNIYCSYRTGCSTKEHAEYSQTTCYKKFGRYIDNLLPKIGKSEETIKYNEDEYQTIYYDKWGWKRIVSTKICEDCDSNNDLPIFISSETTYDRYDWCINEDFIITYSADCEYRWMKAIEYCTGHIDFTDYETSGINCENQWIESKYTADVESGNIIHDSVYKVCYRTPSTIYYREENPTILEVNWKHIISYDTNGNLSQDVYWDNNNAYFTVYDREYYRDGGGITTYRRQDYKRSGHIRISDAYGWLNDVYKVRSCSISQITAGMESL